MDAGTITTEETPTETIVKKRGRPKGSVNGVRTDGTATVTDPKESIRGYGKKIFALAFANNITTDEVYSLIRGQENEGAVQLAQKQALEAIKTAMETGGSAALAELLKKLSS